uniref:Uncharacterized protein n=1 Tax=Solanum lycopersicum TaxID=4081 RepID=A0A3Q7HNX8_SOLLC
MDRTNSVNEKADFELGFHELTLCRNHTRQTHRNENFQTKALDIVEYFLGTEIAQSKSKNFISQRKCALYFLEETGMIECRPTTIPMDRNASGGSPPPGCVQ